MRTRRGGGYESYLWAPATDNVIEARVRIEVQWRTPIAGTGKGQQTFTVKRGKIQK